MAFASRALSSAVKKYAQLDKEELAIVFGVRHFPLLAGTLIYYLFRS